MSRDKTGVARRTVLGLLAGLIPTVFLPGRAMAQGGPGGGGMDCLAAIKTRRSVRAFKPDPVDDAAVETILRCGMQAPSACNEQPWQFVVIRDKAVLEKIGGINPYAAYAKNAPVSILVAGDISLDKCGGYWVQDCSACAENMLLAAHALGLGAVWTGIYPLPERVEAFGKLLSLPDTVTAMSLLVIGHPAETPAPVDRYRADRVHRDKW